jgi:branched-subunit amino acid ABC-type transport system permease component
VFHVAHGTTFVLAGYLFYIAYSLWHWPMIAAYLFTIIGSILYGVILELAVYRLLRKKEASIVMILISSLGLLIITENVISLFFGPDARSLMSGALPTIQVGNDIRITVTDLAAIILAAVVFIILYFVMTKTRIGKMMRAIADNPDMAMVVGMNPNKIYLVVFSIGSGLVALAAPLQALSIGVRPDLAFSITFISVIAVIIGGIGYLPGAALGAIFLGLLETLSMWQLPSSWKTTVVFVILLIFLVIRPEGFFGSKSGTRRA